MTVWDAPHRLEYLWHIFLEPDRATRVSVSFAPTGAGTHVTLVNSGIEIFGDAAEERMGRVGSAWAGITEHFVEAM